MWFLQRQNYRYNPISLEVHDCSWLVRCCAPRAYFLRRKRRHQKKKGEMNMVNAREGSKNVQRRTVFTTFPYISSGLVRQRRYSSIVYAKCYWRLAVACTGSIADEARQNRAHWHITSIAFGDDSLLAHVGTNECHKSLRNCQQNQCAIIICFSMASNIDTRCPGFFRVCWNCLVDGPF